MPIPYVKIYDQRVCPFIYGGDMLQGDTLIVQVGKSTFKNVVIVCQEIRHI